MKSAGPTPSPPPRHECISYLFIDGFPHLQFFGLHINLFPGLNIFGKAEHFPYCVPELQNLIVIKITFMTSWYVEDEHFNMEDIIEMISDNLGGHDEVKNEVGRTVAQRQ